MTSHPAKFWSMAQTMYFIIYTDLPRDVWPSVIVTNDPPTASHDCPAPTSDFIPSESPFCARDALSTRQSKAFSCESMATLASCTRRVALTGEAAVELMPDGGQTSELPTIGFSDVLHGRMSTDCDLNINNLHCIDRTLMLF